MFWVSQDSFTAAFMAILRRWLASEVFFLEGLLLDTSRVLLQVSPSLRVHGPCCSRASSLGSGPRRVRASAHLLHALTLQNCLVVQWLHLWVNCLCSAQNDAFLILRFAKAHACRSLAILKTVAYNYQWHESIHSHTHNPSSIAAVCTFFGAAAVTASLVHRDLPPSTVPDLSLGETGKTLLLAQAVPLAMSALLYAFVSLHLPKAYLKLIRNPGTYLQTPRSQRKARQQRFKLITSTHSRPLVWHRIRISSPPVEPHRPDQSPVISRSSLQRCFRSFPSLSSTRSPSLIRALICAFSWCRHSPAGGPMVYSQKRSD